MGKKAIKRARDQVNAKNNTEPKSFMEVVDGVSETTDSLPEAITMGVESVSKKQPSRKGKKSWRKNIDLTTVEKSLEEKEKDLITYGPSISETADNDLFKIDVKGDGEKAAKALSTRDRLLAKRSAVTALMGRKSPGVIRPQSKLEAKVAKSLQSAESKNRNKKPQIKDIWEDEAPIKQKHHNSKDDSFVDSLPPSLTKKAIVSDVELSHSGASYNPNAKDLQDLRDIRNKLIQPAPSKEVLDATRSLIKVCSRDSAFSAAEMVEVSKETAPETSSESISAKIAKATKRKDRRKKLALLEIQKNKKANLQRKRLNSELDNLTAIKEKVESSLEAQAVKKERMDKKRKIDKHIPVKKIGLSKVPLQDIAVAAEPSSTLRQIKTSSNLYKDQYIGLQARNLIEPKDKTVRKNQSKPKYRLVNKSAHEY
ncbi:hypothetical protein DSO57_1026056 [Entomophthora muscae]|uniref:Uncharacterized protein n=1 Tax=Entomophthora muscae TaxID=34485 RepID=A0ACC2SRG1_9FUNG|nr:hypothetical protein DSO57_1026056 [Entomophthora muscae]